MNERDQGIVDGLRQLSSGTIASLTNLREYKDIDRHRTSVTEWAKEVLTEFPGSFEDWQEAWECYPFHCDDPMGAMMGENR